MPATTTPTYGFQSRTISLQVVTTPRPMCPGCAKRAAMGDPNPCKCGGKCAIIVGDS
jgi:hypothetical protein